MPNQNIIIVGHTIYGQGGVEGYVAYSNTTTDTITGLFRITEIYSSGQITGLFECVTGVGSIS